MAAASSEIEKSANDNDDPQLRDETTQSFPPSHILQNGRFVYLPQPTESEKAQFLERSIARYGFLQSDLAAQDDSNKDDNEHVPTEQEQQEAESNATTKTTPSIHPLAVASARLQANGIAELSKAVNLSGLVATGEYFGLTNIVDPSLEQVAQLASATTSSSASASTAITAAGQGSGQTTNTNATTTTNTSTASLELTKEQQLRAEYVGKRKRLQFQNAHTSLERHLGRLAAALSAQAVLDDRLQQLRPHWRLVAPEHGTRALPHATKPSELVAVDVHVYDKDRTGGGSSGGNNRAADAGTIARRVPRFATIELKEDYKVDRDLSVWKQKYSIEKQNASKVEESTVTLEEGEPDDTTGTIKTRAEPFAVADPTLGKIDVDFDPEKMPMLTLQFDISKPSTGFLQCTRLSTMTACAAVKDENDNNNGDHDTTSSDERVIVALQHSLFCASLFESIRQELVPEEEERTVGRVNKKSRRTVWLSSEMDENFLPPPSLMAGGDDDGSGGGAGGRSLAVVHCHEGEVMVQLDCEYSLTVKLVAAETAAYGSDTESMDIDTKDKGAVEMADSGSQTPQQLHALCRALLLHAQEAYHEHSIKSRERMRRRETKDALGLARIKNPRDMLPPARILESCVNLGAKMIFERKIRLALRRVCQWAKSNLQLEESLKVEWLPLSTFDTHSQFALRLVDVCLDGGIDRDQVKMTITGDGGRSGSFRQVTFHLAAELELFLKMEIRRRLAAQNEEASGALTPPIQNLQSRST